MAKTATCTTSDCSEKGLAKDAGLPLAPGDTIVCGECGQPCELSTGELPDDRADE